jgi:hypothetical protein
VAQQALDQPGSRADWIIAQRFSLPGLLLLLLPPRRWRQPRVAAGTMQSEEGIFAKEPPAFAW